MTEIEELKCPTCKKAMRLLGRHEVEKWEVWDCHNCGLAEIFRDKEGKVVEYCPIEYGELLEAIKEGVYEKELQDRIKGRR